MCNSQLKGIKKILNHHTVVVPIFQLPEALQEEIMHWIFRNEDRYVISVITYTEITRL